jgi:hypothetical protein
VADSFHGSGGDKILGLAVIAIALVIVVVVTARTEGGRPKDRAKERPFMPRTGEQHDPRCGRCASFRRDSPPLG